MVAPIYDLLPFPPPPSPPGTGFSGWLRRRLSKKSLVEDAINDPAPPLPRTATELIQQRPDSPRPRPVPRSEPMPRRTPAFISIQPHVQPALEAAVAAAISSPATPARTTAATAARHVNFPEPTTTAYFSPPSVLSTSSGSSSSSSFLDSSLPDSSPSTRSDTGVGDSASGGLGSRRQWARSVADLRMLAEQSTERAPATATAAPPVDPGFEVLLQYRVDGIQPFLIFLLGMPFVGVATQTGCVGAMSHGIKRAIGGIKIEGGGKVVKRALPKVPSPPPEPVCGREYATCDVDEWEADMEEACGRCSRRDKGKGRAD
jgi:hypothetical protein